MVHRDPDTGQFMADDSMSMFDDIEVATFGAEVGIEAANLSGGAGFTAGDSGGVEGEPLLDYDDFVDRNEELHLLQAEHYLSVYGNSTQTADGTVRAYAEFSASPGFSTLSLQTISTSSLAGDVNGSAVGSADGDDSIDFVGRPLVAMAGTPFSDGGSGVGGAGTQGDDSYSNDEFPSEYGRFHPRDELFLNLQFEVWNIADAGVHADVTGQHIYGVIED